MQETSDPKNLNCWEFTKCGREPGGSRSAEMGVCPAAIASKADGINGGKNGGRACWALTGTFCGDVVQSSCEAKMGDCLRCKFYNLVRVEEWEQFQNAEAIKKLLNK